MIFPLKRDSAKQNDVTEKSRNIRSIKHIAVSKSGHVYRYGNKNLGDTAEGHKIIREMLDIF